MGFAISIELQDRSRMPLFGEADMDQIFAVLAEMWVSANGERVA
jgi:hypothetical protein